MKLFGAMDVKDNELRMGGIRAKELAREFGTPLYVMDENLIRNNCRDYFNNFMCEERENRVVFAGKSCMNMAMCNIVKEEGLFLDVVSAGELYTAYKSGFPMEKIYFHGNNKTIEEINMGIKLGVGIFIVDNYHELECLNKIAGEQGIKQSIYIRVTPGIEAHTHEYIQTGQLDSKFGFSTIDNNVIDVINNVKKCENINLIGLHCHIGSQIFDLKPFEDEVEIVLGLMNQIYLECGIRLRELDLGGGFGIYYTEGDEPKSINEYCETIINKVEEVCAQLNYPRPILSIEPGRSIVGNAGTTLYEMGAIKNIKGIRTYASVDGGMSDNIRPALYGADYESVVANRVKGDEELVTVAGKCCESGDVLIKDVSLTKLQAGDIIATFSTGAYGFSMASNYNRLLTPALVMIKDGVPRIVSKRQSYEDLIRNESL